MNRMLRCSLVVVFGVMSFLNASAVEVKRTDAPVTIDGRLDEPIWQEAQSYRLNHSMSGSIKNVTTVQLAWDDSHLYAAFVCNDANMSNIVSGWAHDEERDNTIWTDDCVELFLDPWGAREQHYQIVVNTSSVIYDAFMGSAYWDANVRSAAAKLADKWIIEIAIPFADLRVIPKGGETWLGNLCREQKGDKENTSVYRTQEGFGDRGSFGQIVFVPSGSDVAFHLEQVSNGRVVGKINNGANTGQQVRVEIRNPDDDAVVAWQEYTVGPRKKSDVSLSFNQGLKAVKLAVTTTPDGKAIYTNSIPLTNHDVAVQTRARVWQVDRPIYKELLSDEPMGLAKEGTMFWTHGMTHYEMRPFAHQYGLRYVYDEYHQLLGKHKLYPFANHYTLIADTYNFVHYLRTHDYNVILSPTRTEGSEFKIGRYPFFCDPDVTEAFLKTCHDNIIEHKDVIWAVNAGDELIEQDEAAGIELFETVKDKYPYIRQVDEEVKTRYGGGKYGIPLGMKDNNPFRRMAYRRWLNDRHAEIFIKLYQTAKAANPDIRVISHDPNAFDHPYDFSRASEYCDIVTHQLYPKRDANRAPFGFVTKLVADLAGIEVWPCAHVEEYGASFTPQEVVELVSQVFRNGGTGLHFYFADTVGRRAKKKHMHMEYWGAPDRWQISMALAEEARNMNRLKFPKPDFAIMYSCDSRAAQGRVPTDHNEVAYTLLGPFAGSWFKFIDDYQIERGTVNLSDFRVVYVPFAPYQRPAVVKKLIEYVKSGGRVVFGDAEAFRHDTVGNELTQMRAELFGDGTKKDRIPAVLQGLVSKDAKFAPPAGRRVGRGQVYYFESNPFVIRSLRSDDIIAFFKKFQTYLGLATDQDIWRFQFPMDLIKHQPAPSGVCLTNNHILWRSFNPLTSKNQEVAGTYTYSLAPDNISDQGGLADIPFKDGDLTDRRNAPAAGNVDLKMSSLNDWVVRYKTTEPFHITFDLAKPRELARVTIFASHSGTRPAIRVEGSEDAENWAALGDSPALIESADDVRDITISLAGGTARYLRVHFDQRPADHMLTLSEVEIWAANPK